MLLLFVAQEQRITLSPSGFYRASPDAGLASAFAEAQVHVDFNMARNIGQVGFFG